MTTMRETAINKPLSGLELRALIERDFVDRLLPNEGSLSAHIAYGRVAYEIRLVMHTGNPLMPRTEISVESQPVGVNALAELKNDKGEVVRPARPELAAIERPVRGSSGITIGGTKLTRAINSPNAERVREGLPVPIEVRQQDGTKTIEKIVYPPEPGAGDGDMRVEDATEEARTAWNGLPSTDSQAAR